jgi:hypothetical protein
MRERRTALILAALGLALVVAAFAVGRATRSEGQDVASPAPELSGEDVSVSIPELAKGSIPGMRAKPAAPTADNDGGTGDSGGDDTVLADEGGGTDSTATGTGTTSSGTGTAAPTDTTPPADTGGSTGFDEVPGGTE